MSYSCPICRNTFTIDMCIHDIGQYVAYVYRGGTVSIWKRYSGNEAVLVLTKPKQLTEEYLDKMVLLV